MMARWFLLLFLVQMCTEGLESLIEGPDVKTLFSGIYSSLSVTTKDFSHPKARPRDVFMLSESDNIKHITRELEQTGADRRPDTRLAQLIVDDLYFFSGLGRMDLGITWQKYMEDYTALPTNLRSTDKVALVSLKLHRWCSQIAQKSWPKKCVNRNWKEAFIRNLGHIAPTKENVKLAVDFHRFVMIWGMSTILEKMAIAFALIAFTNEIVVCDVMEKIKSCYPKHEFDEYLPQFKRLINQSLRHQQEKKPKSIEEFTGIFKEIVSVQWPQDLLQYQRFMHFVATLLSSAICVKQDIPLVFSSAYALGRSMIGPSLQLNWHKIPLVEVEKRLDEFWEGDPLQTGERVQEFRVARDLYKEFCYLCCAEKDLDSAFRIYQAIANTYHNGRKPSLQSAKLLVGHMTEFQHMLAEGAKFHELVLSRKVSPWDIKEIAFLLLNLLTPPFPPGFDHLWSWIIPEIGLCKLPSIFVKKIIEMKHKWEERLDKLHQAQVLREFPILERWKIGGKLVSQSMGKKNEEAKNPEKEDKILKESLASFGRTNFPHLKNDLELENKVSNYKIIRETLSDHFDLFYETSIVKFRLILEKRWNQYLNTPISHFLYYAMTRLESNSLLNALEFVDQKTQNVKIGPKMQMERLGISLRQMASYSNKISYVTWKKEILPMIYDIPYDWAEWWIEIFQDSVSKKLHEKLEEFIAEKSELDRKRSQNEISTENHSNHMEGIIRGKAKVFDSRTGACDTLSLNGKSATQIIANKLQTQVKKQAQLMIKMRERLAFLGNELHHFDPDDTLDQMIEKEVGNMAVMLENGKLSHESGKNTVGALLT